MLEFLRPIASSSVWMFYIILGFVALFFIRVMWVARIEQVRSIFSLERENATDRMVRAFIGLLIVLSLMIGLNYLSAKIPNIVPPPPATVTPTPPFQLPPSPTPPPPLWVLPSPTTTATPTGTPTPAPPTESTPFFEATVESPAATSPVSAPPAAACGNLAHITSPGNGARMNGIIEVRGAAAVENFLYYKFEYRAAGGNWTFAQRYNLPVADGVLGMWNTDTVTPGQYEFRLVVVDTTGNYPPPCVVQLVVE